MASGRGIKLSSSAVVVHGLTSLSLLVIRFAKGYDLRTVRTRTDEPQSQSHQNMSTHTQPHPHAHPHTRTPKIMRILCVSSFPLSTLNTLLTPSLTLVLPRPLTSENSKWETRGYPSPPHHAIGPSWRCSLSVSPTTAPPPSCLLPTC